MNRLPLSWCRNEIDYPCYNTVELPLSGISWISTAEIPLRFSNQEFFDDLIGKYPRFVIRGVSAGSAAYLKDLGADMVRTGAEAVVDLTNPPHFKRSVLELARRGGRNGAVHEVPFSEFYINKVSRLALQSTHAPEPGLTYLFRNGFDVNTRCFVLATGEGDWLGALTVSFQDRYYAHTESILRRKNAPTGVMESLFVSVMGILRQEGYTHFSLGEVPFVTGGPDEPVLNEPGSYVKKLFLRSKHVLKYSFNYKGLYQFKNKFGPRWKPAYLVSKPGISWSLLTDLYIQSHLIDLSVFKLLSCFKKYSPKLLKTG